MKSIIGTALALVCLASAPSLAGVRDAAPGRVTAFAAHRALPVPSTAAGPAVEKLLLAQGIFPDASTDIFASTGTGGDAVFSSPVRYEKFGLGFSVPAAFTVKADDANGLVVADNDLKTPDGCALSVSLKGDNRLDGAPATIAVTPLPDRVLGQNARFKGASLRGTMSGIQMSGLVVASADPIADGRYVHLALSCAGSGAEKADRIADALLADLHYAAPNGASAAPETQTPQGDAARDSAMELAFWDAIKDSSDAADFQAYLDQFPDGTFAALARNKIKRFGGGTATPATPAEPQVSTGAYVLDYAGDHDWTYYFNDRYGTSIEYPADVFVPQPAPTNDDGRRFASHDGLASFYVFAQYNALQESLAALFDADRSRAGEQVAYQKSGPNWFEVSGYRGTDIFYRKTTLTADDLLQVFEIAYAQTLGDGIVPMINRMASTFPGRASGYDPTATAPVPQQMLNEGWWVILGSLPTEPWERQQTDYDRMHAAAAPCGLEVFNDLSGKFEGFRAGYNVFVVGAFESQSDANGVLKQARKCFPDAYIKSGKYLGE